uniref:Uncharacterized protein n=1 Tax=viral metagenome TaxID=1070528 RepID=A0A6C0DHA5_9ZZZZ
MPKYLIEGNINFYDELYKSLDNYNDSSKDNKEEETNENENNFCLITQKPLTENYVQLECKHKFNYNAIFHDVLNHKKKFNTLERRTLKLTELRCPYCRNIQRTLLPHVEGFPKIHGINHIDEENINGQYMKMGYTRGKCCYQDETCDKCDNIFVKIMMTNNKSYCYTHYSQMIHKIIKEKQEKMKEEKMKKKMAALQKKQEEKQKKQEAKNAEKQKKLEEKQALGTCVSILKTGVNKGKACGCQVIPDSNGLCSRHYKLSLPKNNMEPTTNITSP